ncbi:MAG: hypothetical protein MZV70_39500 [Desulfobacterales bacterium]|nr:hypothetical protein [Desulfobacterales bacterium]
MLSHRHGGRSRDRATIRVYTNRETRPTAPWLLLRQVMATSTSDSRPRSGRCATPTTYSGGAARDRGARDPHVLGVPDRAPRVQAQEAGVLRLSGLQHAGRSGAPIARQKCGSIGRLAPQVYLGIVALTVDARGTLRLDRDGEAIEWLVKMRRLPAEHMLDAAHPRRPASTTPSCAAVALRLADFYRRCTPATSRWRRLSRPDSPKRSSSTGASSRARNSVCPPPRSPRRMRLTDFLAHDAPLLDARVSAGRIAEGHGDLRLEHICLEPEAAIIDCLEFNREFRIVDPADELAFRHRGMRLPGRAGGAVSNVANTCLAAMGDAPPTRLVIFYKLFRATMRARLAIWHVQELNPEAWPRWRRSAQDYLALAAGYTRQLAARA